MNIGLKFLLLFLGSLLLALVIGGVVTYDSVKKEVKKETDYSLAEEKRILAGSIAEGKPISALINRKVKISQGSIEEWPEDKRGTFRDTLMLHVPTDNMEIFRSHTSVIHIDSAAYQITLTDVFIEETDLLEGVIQTMTRLFVVISLLFLLVGFLFAHYLLKPFYNTLDSIQNFRVSDQIAIDLPRSSTKEFNTLNSFLTDMMKKAKSDFHTLKEFTQNASHEIQTPISIIKGKLELLQEGEHLREKDLKLIGDSQASLARLSSLTDSLALLTKLENKEFVSVDSHNFSNVTERLVQEFRELAELKGLKFQNDIQPNVNLRIEEPLSEILISNLLKNAIVHNVNDGQISLSLSDEMLVVKNTGKELAESPEQ